MCGLEDFSKRGGLKKAKSLGFPQMLEWRGLALRMLGLPLRRKGLKSAAGRQLQGFAGWLCGSGSLHAPWNLHSPEW